MAVLPESGTALSEYGAQWLTIVRNEDVVDSKQQPVAIVTGGSAGLGLEIVRALLTAGYAVVMVGRDRQRLSQGQADLLAQHPELAGIGITEVAGDRLTVWAGDVSQADQISGLIEQTTLIHGRLDVLVNCVGVSDRGRVDDLTPQRVHELIDANVVTALLCSQAALPLLAASGGSVINIGSLAARVGAPFLGGYPLAKHALAGLTQQMRQEWQPRGVHVGLLNPGPIRRSDAGKRYTLDQANLPDHVAQPAGGAKVKGLPPERVAAAVVRMIRTRQPDVVLPAHLRLLVAIGHACPRLGEWLLGRFTSRPAKS